MRGVTFAAVLLVFSASLCLFASQADEDKKFWYELVRQYLRDQGIALPSAAEIDSMAGRLKKLEEGNLRDFKRERREITEKLKNENLPLHRRQHLKDHLDTLDGLIRTYGQKRSQLAENPEIAELEKRILRQVAEEAVLDWKFHKVLYERYGGRVVLDESGWKPIDAYQKFLNEIREQRYVQRMGTAYADLYNRIFERYYRHFEDYLDQPHQFVEREQADLYFRRPWWEHDKPLP